MIEFFLNKKVFVNLITILMIAFGITAMLQLKRASYPDVEFDILKITTTYPGASAEDVEINVTEKLEDEIETVVDLDRTISNSLENLSIIYVWVDPDAQDPDEVKDEVRRAVDRVQDLPSVVEKPLIDELKSSNVSVVEIAISGEADESILRKVARDLEDEIKEVDGVGSVEKVGYRKQEVQVLLDPEHMEANYVSIGEVITAIANRNIRASGGTLESFTNEKKIVTFSEFENPLDVKDVIVRKNFQGNNLRLADFSRVDYTYEDFDVITRSNKRRNINLQVRSQANADIIDISQDINKIIAQKKTVLQAQR
ncbi:MAG: efflux RND transporter permease subunit [Deltaproteobacteria bacterium]|nr:efflux RND transporter permease subunit [Deltaproteobacteria bacterium]